jgi:hypothetical protein
MAGLIAVSACEQNKNKIKQKQNKNLNQKNPYNCAIGQVKVLILTCFVLAAYAVLFRACIGKRPFVLAQPGLVCLCPATTVCESVRHILTPWCRSKG